MNRLILDDLWLLPSPLDTDINVGPSRASSQDVKHTHVHNVKDIHSDDYVV
jgi:hypothetical protein